MTLPTNHQKRSSRSRLKIWGRFTAFSTLVMGSYAAIILLWTPGLLTHAAYTVLIYSILGIFLGKNIFCPWVSLGSAFMFCAPLFAWLSYAWGNDTLWPILAVSLCCLVSASGFSLSFISAQIVLNRAVPIKYVHTKS